MSGPFTVWCLVRLRATLHGHHMFDIEVWDYEQTYLHDKGVMLEHRGLAGPSNSNCCPKGSVVR